MELSNACVFLAAFVSLQCLSSVSCGAEHDTELETIKVKLTVYMEALCPHCHAFIKTKLFPVFDKYYQYIQLDMVPYGNAHHHKNKDGKWEFTCQHGQPECLGNMYLACATHILERNQSRRLMRYYNCLADANSYSIAQDVKKCAPIAEVKFDKLDTCVKTKGPELLAQFGDRTHGLKGIKYVPTVVIEDKFDINEEDKIKNDLLGSICKSLKGHKPADCKKTQYTNVDKRLDTPNMNCYVDQ